MQSLSELPRCAANSYPRPNQATISSPRDHARGEVIFAFTNSTRSEINIDTMDIPRGEYNFKNEHALLIVTGKQAGRLFYASEGKVEELDAGFIPTPKYSDREGFFARSGAGRTYGFGSVYEPKDQETKRKFMRMFSDKVEKAVRENNISSIYLFSPNYEITEFKESLSPEVSAKLRFTFMGNFVRFAPHEPLKKITARMEKTREKSQMRGAEEQKILAPKEKSGPAKRQAPRLKFS
jgi:hypothetical protein